MLSNIDIIELALKARMQWRKSEREWKFAFINGPSMPMLGRRQGAVFGPISSIEDLIQNPVVSER